MRKYCTTEQTLFVTLDIGKNVHWFGAYAGFDLEEIASPFKVRSDRGGFEQVTTILDALLACGAYEQVVLGHEPTGIYHENWARELYDRYQPQREGVCEPRLDYRFLNPLTSKKRREVQANGRKRKTDPIDLKAIAYCLRDGQGQPAFLPTGQELQFQLWGKAYRNTERERRQLTRAILSQLDRLWPGAAVNLKRFKKMHPELDVPVPLVRSKPLERKRVRAILTHSPNPHCLLNLGQDGIQAFLRQHVGRCGSATANLVYDLLQNAVLPPPEVAALLADYLQDDFQRYLNLDQRLDILKNQAEIIVPDSPAAVLTTAPGISPFLAARYLAYLGHHRRFLSPAEIWAFAGFDIVTDESGDYRRVGKITKKGAKGLRDTLFMIGFHMANHIPALQRIRNRAVQRGKSKIAATIHVAQKGNRICYHLLYHQIPFDPDKLR
ncbi:MAG: transposase [Verrucomicrobiota bacterium]